MTTTQLNAVAELLEANGIKATKEVVFSVCIKTLTDAGVTVRDAFDAVLGAGRLEQFAGDLHAALNA